MSNRLTRRDFLKVGCGATVATLLACGGLGYIGTLPPDVPTPDTTVKGNGNMKEMLVTYATRAGSTVQVAETIAQTLATTGATVDVRPVKNVKDIKGYDAVVIGSAIRMGAWLPEAVQFVKTNQSTLAGIPIAYFLVSGFLKNDTPEMRKTVGAYLDPVRQILEPKSIGLFAGKMDWSKLNFFDRTLAKAMGEKEGDWRNWEAIKTWSEEIKPVLVHA